MEDNDLAALKQLIVDCEIVDPISGSKAVSYTHLDVYKRQTY